MECLEYGICTYVFNTAVFNTAVYVFFNVPGSTQ